MTRNRNCTPIINRPYAGDEDFWRIRRLISSAHRRVPLDFNWDVRRLDGWRFYRPDPADDRKQRTRTRLWETGEGRLVGAVFSEGLGDACPQLDPEYREIEEEMFAWAESNLAKPSKDGKERSLLTRVFEYDKPRLTLLKKRGYVQTDMSECIRRLRFGEQDLPARRTLPAGYTLRCTRADELDAQGEAQGDAQRIAELLNAAFNRDFHCGMENHVFSTQAPSFCRELDMVAEAADGSFACYVACAVDEGNWRGIFEPVCTHPEHLRQGLAQTLMFEVLHQLDELGYEEITVGTGSAEAANRLYESLGFTEFHSGSYWRKTMPLE